MNISYIGQMQDEEQNTRVAVITYKATEQKLFERIEDLMYKTTMWKGYGCDECFYVPVDDRDDYNDFVAFYKEAKKTFKLCEKYGF